MDANGMQDDGLPPTETSDGVTIESLEDDRIPSQDSSAGSRIKKRERSPSSTSAASCSKAPMKQQPGLDCLQDSSMALQFGGSQKAVLMPEDPELDPREASHTELVDSIQSLMDGHTGIVSSKKGSVILLDVETTGWPASKNPELAFGTYPPHTDTHKYDAARIVQICFMVCDKDLNISSVHSFIVDSHGLFKIPNSFIHGITDEISTTQGTDLGLVMSELMAVLAQADTVVAHNANFDVSVLKAELYRSGNTGMLDELSRKQVVCSMKECKVIVNAQWCGDVKNPNLVELYKFATKKVIKKTHNAEYDVRNMHEALQIMLSKGQFKLPAL